MDLKKHLLLAIEASLYAGKEILEIYHKDFVVEYKDDHSPLTKADQNAHNKICEHLSKVNLPILSEEGKEIPYDERKNWEDLWIVDPLDGTKEFIKKNDEFTVNIALVKNGIPLLGVILAPAIGKLYFGARDLGSYYTPIDMTQKEFDLEEIFSMSRKLPFKQLVNHSYKIVASRSHLNTETENIIDNIRNAHSNLQFISIGSSLKFCLLAEGKANIYPRLAPTMEWDTAAGHAILKYSGGNVWQYNEGIEVVYNKENLLNPWFVAELK